MEKKTYYTVLPAEVRYNKKLSPNAKILFSEIILLSNKTGYCWATNNYFAELYEVSKVSVSLWVKELIDNNYIGSHIIYKENSKEIHRRILYIREEHFDKNENLKNILKTIELDLEVSEFSKNYIGGYKNFNTCIKENLVGGIKEKLKDNIKIDNIRTTNNKINNNTTNLENSSNQRIHKFEQSEENLNNQRNSEENLKFNDFQEIENSKRNKQSNFKFDDFLENKHQKDEKKQKNDIFDLDMQDEKDLIENKKQQEIKISKEKRLTKEEYDNLFNLFWKQYPRKEGKAQAKKNFIHAIRESGFEKIMQSLETYKKDLEIRKVEKFYIMHGSTFIGTKSGGRYMDYLPEEIEENNPSEFVLKELSEIVSEKHKKLIDETFTFKELKEFKTSFMKDNEIQVLKGLDLHRFQDFLFEEIYKRKSMK